MFLNISRIKNIRSNCYTIFFKYFPIIFFWWKIYSFPVIFIYKRLNFVILYGSVFVFHTLMWPYSVLKALLKASFLLIGFIVAFLFFIQSGVSIFDPPRFGFFYDIYDKYVLFIDYKLFWYLFLAGSKSHFRTSSASSLIVVSMLSLFKCISRTSSLSMEEIKLFVSVNWIFHEIIDVVL